MGVRCSVALYEGQRGMGAMFFFFKQKTGYEIRPRDWSSDVCSSDLGAERDAMAELGNQYGDVENTHLARCSPYYLTGVPVDSKRIVGLIIRLAIRLRKNITRYFHALHLSARDQLKIEAIVIRVVRTRVMKEGIIQVGIVDRWTSKNGRGVGANVGKVGRELQCVFYIKRNIDGVADIVDTIDAVVIEHADYVIGPRRQGNTGISMVADINIPLDRNGAGGNDFSIPVAVTVGINPVASVKGIRWSYKIAPVNGYLVFIGLYTLAVVFAIGNYRNLKPEVALVFVQHLTGRSEERRVGKE